jgi:hypothetical protein
MGKISGYLDIWTAREEAGLNTAAGPCNAIGACSYTPRIQKSQHGPLHTVVLNLSCSRTPRCNFSSTLYPQSCWCIIQVIHSL